MLSCFCRPASPFVPPPFRIRPAIRKPAFAGRFLPSYSGGIFNPFSVPVSYLDFMVEMAGGNVFPLRCLDTYGTKPGYITVIFPALGL